MTMPDDIVFKCAEFDGCDLNYCAYEGEEECHWRNVPVEGCKCRDCYEGRMLQAGMTIA